MRLRIPELLVACVDEFAAGYHGLRRSAAIRVLIERGLAAKAAPEVTDPMQVLASKGSRAAGRFRHARKSKPQAAKPAAAPPCEPAAPPSYRPARRVKALAKSEIDAAVARAVARSEAGGMNGKAR